MRLLIATDSAPPTIDGLSSFLAKILPLLAKRHELVLVAPAGTERFADFELVEIPLSRLRLGGYALAKFSSGVIAREVARAAVVLSHSLGPIGGLAILKARRAAKPLVAYIHSLLWRAAPNPGLRLAARALSRWLYPKCDVLVAPSRYAELELRRLVNKKIARIEPGVDSARFRPPRSKAAAKAALGLGGFVVGYVGRLSAEKELGTLARAFEQFSRAVPAKLLVVGCGSPRTERKLRGLPNCAFVGPVRETRAWLQAADAFVLPSRTEGACLALLEALACGVPVIATPVGLAPQLIESGRNGWLIRHKDSGALAARLAELAAAGKSERARMSRAARASVSTLCWSATAAAIERVLEPLTGSERKANYF